LWLVCPLRLFIAIQAQTAVSRLFRGKFIASLCKARNQGQLTYAGQLSNLAEADGFNRLLCELRQIEWVVYAKPPFGGPEQVLKYLARYTHRVAISNGRLLKLTDDEVTFNYKDYAAGNVTRTMTLDVHEFARRFLLHVLPRGFVRIRYYGFLANGCRAKKLELCRRLLSADKTESRSINETHNDDDQGNLSTAPKICPNCKQGKLFIVEKIAKARQTEMSAPFPPSTTNTS
jgi:Putative transposase